MNELPEGRKINSFWDSVLSLPEIPSLDGLCTLKNAHYSRILRSQFRTIGWTQKQFFFFFFFFKKKNFVNLPPIFLLINFRWWHSWDTLGIHWLMWLSSSGLRFPSSKSVSQNSTGSKKMHFIKTSSSNCIQTFLLKVYNNLSMCNNLCESISDKIARIKLSNCNL